MNRDLVIIGGGPGGYVAAIRAAQLGIDTLVVEREAFGGTCLNVGCIPTKALYRSAQIMNYARHSEQYGINVNGFSIDMDKVQERKNKIVSTLTNGVELLLKANKVECIKGEARFVDKNTIEITNSEGKQTVTANKIIIATGSKSFVPSIKGIDLEGVISSNEALDLDHVPEEVVLIGGGFIGLEFACILQAFGSKVTAIKYSPILLPAVDNEVTKRLKISLEKKGIKILVFSRVQQIEKLGERLKVTVDVNGEIKEIVCDKVLVCAGREMEVGGLNIEAVGVECGKKGIIVDENYETNVKGIYAIGDVTGRVLLAHVASEEGKVCVERMAGHKTAVNYDIVPNNIFTFPEVSSVGMTEDEAKSKGIDCVTSKFLFAANGKALTMGESEGLIKIIASADKQKLLGVHIMGPHASDLIHEAVIAMSGGMTVKEVGDTMHGHPTLPEAFVEAVNGVLGTAIHIAPMKNRG